MNNIDYYEKKKYTKKHTDIKKNENKALQYVNMNCSVIFNSNHAHAFPHLYIFILTSSYSQNHVVRHSNLQYRFSLKVGLHNKNRGLKQTHKNNS